MKLAIALPMLAATLLTANSGAQPQKAVPYKNVAPEEFERLTQQPKHVILDVRTAKEFSAGHIKGAINIDVNAPDFQEKVGELDKDSTYLVHRAAGGRSVTACEALNSRRFQSLFNLEGGFKAWTKAGKPVEK